jgi:hypothetical protein
MQAISLKRQTSHFLLQFITIAVNILINHKPRLSKTTDFINLERIHTSSPNKN